MTIAIDDRLLVTAEMAERCRVSESTARYWRMIGFGPASFKVGRRVVYRAGDVEAWLGKLRAEQGGGRVA
jgi:predicted DNA-binding transcriptional regulator AlpA